MHKYMRTAYRLASSIRHRRLEPQIHFTGRHISTNSQSSSAIAGVNNGSTIFSGIQPTGVPHLGNYLGALRPWVQIQNSAPASTRLIFCIVDLHALTSRPDPARLRQWKTEALAALLAVGLNPERCTIFFQSEISAHAELMWALSSDASMGYLSRMTQWKSKLALSDSASVDEADVKAKLRLGLFSYPVLQAADILVHGATHVPVGQDQKQHLEFGRECAQSFNSTYGEVLTVPEVIISPAKRVMSLSTPTKKMSKSIGNEESRILLTDSPETIRTKVMRALTDSEAGITYDLERRPGVSNLLEIVAHLEGLLPIDISARYQTSSLRALKEDTARTITEHLTPIREHLLRLLDSKQRDYLDEVASTGRENANASSTPVLERVYDTMGLSRRTRTSETRNF